LRYCGSKACLEQLVNVVKLADPQKPKIEVIDNTKAWRRRDEEDWRAACMKHGIEQGGKVTLPTDEDMGLYC
jgi:hypothetical protein